MKTDEKRPTNHLRHVPESRPERRKNVNDVYTMKSTDVLKYLEGGCSEQEKRAMADWLDASPENVREFNEIRFLFEATKLYEPELKAWASSHGLEERTEHRQEELPAQGTPLAAVQTGKPTAAEAARSRRGMHPLMRRVMRIAAAVVVLIGVGYSTYIYTYDRMAARTLAMEIPDGQRIEMTLPDGSHVWLNAGARLEYPTLFGRHRREVKLSGEAMFEVEHDADHPFVVHTFASDVEVLGTKFNVRAEESENIFSTALMRGRVKVSNRLSSGAGESIYMNPDDCVELVDGHLTLGHIEDPAEYLWPEGIINLHSASFEELIEKFERAYGIRIIIERKELPRIRCRGKIHVSEGIDHALDILRMDADFTYEHDYNRNEIHIR